MDRKLNGKVVVITGASSGFGKGVARKLAKMGASLVLAARRYELLEELSQETQDLAGTAIAIPTDVSKVEEVENLFKSAIATFGRIDVWINNAGAAAIGNFSEVPLEDHEKVLSTTLNGTLYGSYFAMREFIENNSGTLINVASMIGRIPAPYYASYAAAKHGVLGLSGSLRQELTERRLDNIHVCTVLPMAMDTPFFEHAANYTGHEAQPIPPLNEAEDVIDAIIDLIFQPKAELAVGKGSGVFSVSDALAPGLTEKLMAANTHKSQIEKAPPAPPHTGNLHHPSPDGSEVHGDFRAGL
ncbi:MAG: SDR family NAD(P)-dependent oxidoreductase [Candidatus Obscuribacterales bacterium]|jgi:short-subunit dehydrogenase|nr:SDR family NAD(P)-dependent oxidoreductase [Candidatus Obscuribacterales bacterium]